MTTVIVSGFFVVAAICFAGGLVVGVLATEHEYGRTLKQPKESSDE